MRNRFVCWLLTASLILPVYVGAAFAVEIAPRISDREIIEGLTRLDGGLAHLDERITGLDERITRLDERITGLDERITERITGLEKRLIGLDERLIRLEAGQQAMQKQLEQRMDAMQKHTEQRFISLEKRMDDRMNAQWTLTLVLIAAIFGLVGFVVWDRKTALKPLERRVAGIADDLERDFELKSPDGSIVTRLMDALREVASEDRRLADALQRHALLRHAPQRV